MINFFQHPEFYALALMFSYRHMHESFPEKLFLKKKIQKKWLKFHFLWPTLVSIYRKKKYSLNTLKKARDEIYNQGTVFGEEN